MSAFSSSGSSQVSIAGGLAPVATATIINLELAVAALEYTQVVPAGTKRIEIRSRSNQLTRLAYIPTGTTTAYVTINPGSQYFQFDLAVVTLSLYLASPTANNNMLEITFWA